MEADYAEHTSVGSLVINSVNRIPSQILSDTGYMRIAAGDVAELAKTRGGWYRGKGDTDDEPRRKHYS
jgi:hypothetical protein